MYSALQYELRRFHALCKRRERAARATIPMTEQPSPERFKAEMPNIPGVAGDAARRPNGTAMAIRLGVGLAALLLVVVLVARWMMKPKPVEQAAAPPAPTIDVPTPAPDPSTLIPHATAADPGIATTTEMAKAWSSKEFYIKNRLTGQNIDALLIRLPTGSASQPDGYWAFTLNAPYGNCQLEYVEDLNKLRTDYGYRAARHPMVGNPCSRTLFDPLKMANLPGNVWVRGGIALGSDLRPPLGVELRIDGKSIQAIRSE